MNKIEEMMCILRVAINHAGGQTRINELVFACYELVDINKKYNRSKSNPSVQKECLKEANNIYKKACRSIDK